MDRDDDPEKRIAELERQLAEQKRIAELERQLADAKAAARQDHPAEQPPQFSAPQPVAGQDAVDEHARRLAEALRESMRTGQSRGPDVAQLQEALTRAAVESGLSY